jgi:hypothetical protein
MKKTASKLNFVILLITAILMVVPLSYAQEHGHDRDEHRDHRDRDHGRRERVVEHHDNYRDVVVRDRHFFYRGGVFYDRGPRGYVVVTAPIGARVDVLPRGYRIIRHNRLRYYLFGGIYYRFLPRERVYVVVNAPF